MLNRFGELKFERERRGKGKKRKEERGKKGGNGERKKGKEGKRGNRLCNIHVRNVFWEISFGNLDYR